MSDWKEKELKYKERERERERERGVEGRANERKE